MLEVFASFPHMHARGHTYTQEHTHICAQSEIYAFTYFTLVGVVSSDVSRSSCTTSFTPCSSIFSQSYVFFQGCPCPLLDVIDVLHPGAPPSSFPRHHSENACLYQVTLIVSACMSKESHFSFDNLGKEFASSLKFIQYALVCPFLRPTYQQQSSVGPHFSYFYIQQSMSALSKQSIGYVFQCLTFMLQTNIIQAYRHLQRYVHILSNNNSIYLYSAIYPELNSCSEAIIATSTCLSTI